MHASISRINIDWERQKSTANLLQRALFQIFTRRLYHLLLAHFACFAINRKIHTEKTSQIHLQSRPLDRVHIRRIKIQQTIFIIPYEVKFINLSISKLYILFVCLLCVVLHAAFAFGRRNCCLQCCYGVVLPKSSFYQTFLLVVFEFISLRQKYIKYLWWNYHQTDVYMACSAWF